MNSPVVKTTMPLSPIASKTGRNSPSLLKTKMSGTKSPVPGRNRSLSPGRYSPAVNDIQSFGQGALPFHSSEPRSVLFRMNTNPSFIYDYSLTVDPNSAAYRYYKASHAAVLTKTNVPLQDQLVTRPNSPPVGTYYVRMLTYFIMMNLMMYFFTHLSSMLALCVFSCTATNFSTRIKTIGKTTNIIVQNKWTCFSIH